MNTITLTVPGISCQHCVHTITNELSELPGINNVHADKNSKQVEVEFQTPTTEKEIRQLLEEINYPAD